MIGNKFKYYSPFAMVAFIIVIGLICGYREDNKEIDMPKWDGSSKKVKVVEFKNDMLFFDTASFRKELGSLGIECSNIVYAQAKLETGNFKSDLFLKNNNLFGFRGKSGKWMKFNSWQDCCKYYKEWQVKRYRGGDYYKFLVNIGYAEDTSYVKKVKKCLN